MTLRADWCQSNGLHHRDHRLVHILIERCIVLKQPEPVSGTQAYCEHVPVVDIDEV